MRFNDNADLDTSRFEWLGYQPIIPLGSDQRAGLAMDIIGTFWNAFYDFYTVAMTGIIFLVIMAIVASIIDRRSTRTTR